MGFCVHEAGEEGAGGHQPVGCGKYPIFPVHRWCPPKLPQLGVINIVANILVRSILSRSIVRTGVWAHQWVVVNACALDCTYVGGKIYSFTQESSLASSTSIHQTSNIQLICSWLRLIDNAGMQQECSDNGQAEQARRQRKGWKPRVVSHLHMSYECGRIFVEDTAHTLGGRQHRAFVPGSDVIRLTRPAFESEGIFLVIIKR